MMAKTKISMKGFERQLAKYVSENNKLGLMYRREMAWVASECVIVYYLGEEHIASWARLRGHIFISSPKATTEEKELRYDEGVDAHTLLKEGKY